jgi:hypothetical protein
MALESITNPNEMNESADPNQFPIPDWQRSLYAAFIIIALVFSFGAIDALQPEWQSGNMADYFALLLSAEASLVFLILLAYSVLCYILLLIDPHRFAQWFLIRFGVYSGVALALQYSILLLMFLVDDLYAYAILLLWFLPLYFPKLYHLTAEKWVRQYVRGWMLLAVIVMYGILLSIFDQAIIPIVLIFVGIVASAPFWSFLIAGRAALWLYKNYEPQITLPRGLGIAAWLATYAVAWRYDILKMYELYAKLPPEPPNCYIASAAAKGHPNFVGSWNVQLASGKSMHVNRQLQTLKCAELALVAVAPKTHKLVRKMYDKLGKSLARKIQNPFLADIAYLCLKPFERMAQSILRLIIGDVQAYSIRIYTK